MPSETPQPPDLVVATMDRDVLGELRVHSAVLDRDPVLLYELARARVRPHFDLEYTARLIVGPAWTDATPVARTAFVAAFERYLVSSYARALLFVGSETLSVLGAAELVGPQHARLPMRVVMDDGEKIEADIHFRLDEGTWRIWDVRASGISFVRQYRGDFGTEARVRGLAEATKSLEAIARRNEADLREQLRRTGSIRDAR